MDRLTDAWRAGWRGGVVNGVRREALTDRCGGRWVGVGERWREGGRLRGVGAGEGGREQMAMRVDIEQEHRPDVWMPLCLPPRPLTFPNQPLPISCR